MKTDLREECFVASLLIRPNGIRLARAHNRTPQ